MVYVNINKTRIKKAVPIYITIIGIAWLLNVLSVIPEVNWMETVGFAASGLEFLIICEINKSSFFIGIFLLFTSLLVLLRQLGIMDNVLMVPIMIIVAGLLGFLVQILRLSSSEITK